MGGKNLKCLRMCPCPCVSVFFTYFSFGLIVAVDSLRRKKVRFWFCRCRLKTNDRETNKRKKSISTIRSRQRKTTDCLLATALWFVSGSLSFSLPTELCVCVHVSVSCVLCIDIIRADVVVAAAAAAAAATVVVIVIVVAVYSSFVARPPCLLYRYTRWDVRVLYVTLKNFIRKYWLWHVVCAIESRWGDRTNERTNAHGDEKRRNEKKTECPSLCVLFFVFHHFVFVL